MPCEILHPSELSASDIAAWGALQAETPALGSPLLGPEFARAVGTVRTDARVAIWRDGGASAAFLPFHRRPGGFARPIGAPLSDYQALVGRQGLPLHREDVLRGAGLSAFRFSALIDDGALLPAPVATTSIGHRITLASTPADFLAALAAQSGNRAKNFRRYNRLLSRELGPVATRAPDLDQTAFERLLGWKRAQLHRTGLHDFLLAPWIAGLMQRLFETRTGAFQGLMISLYAGDRHLAGHFGVRLGDWYHPWIAARDPELDLYSPGSVHQWTAIEAMGPLGLRTYDLGTGSDAWKRLFANDTVEVRIGLARARSFGGGLAGWSDGLWSAPGLRKHEFARRLRNRLDQIATMELSARGRLRGVVDALNAFERRSAARRGDRQAQA